MLGGYEIPGTGFRIELSSFLMGAVLMVVLLFAYHAMYLAPKADANLVVGANGAGLPPPALAGNVVAGAGSPPALGANGAGLPPTTESFGAGQKHNAASKLFGGLI